MTGPWARAFLDALPDGVRHLEVSDTVSDLRIESSLITARVGDRPVTLSAPPVSPGVWAAIAAQVTPDRQSLELAQLLEHTWEEPLVPSELVRVGADADVAAVAGAVAAAIESDPSTLLRFRGYEARPARRPPDSVPKRFGASGIPTADGELVEVLVRAYRAFGE